MFSYVQIKCSYCLPRLVAVSSQRALVSTNHLNDSGGKFLEIYTVQQVKSNEKSFVDMLNSTHWLIRAEWEVVVEPHVDVM